MANTSLSLQSFSSSSGVSLILGGVKSGKSRFAERLATSSKKDLVYIATADSNTSDSDMQSRIESHKQSRGDNWRTIEAPLKLTDTLRQNVGPDTCILVDCLTLWLSNLLTSKSGASAFDEELSNLTTFLDSLSSTSHVILVSNELGLGGVAMDTVTRHFQDCSGILNERIAVSSQNVWLVTAGLGHKLK